MPRCESLGSKEIQENTCMSNTIEEVNVSVPVSVRAYSNVGKASINCMGTPVINTNSFQPTCEHCSVSKFMISQNLLVEIPVMFGAEVEVGSEHVYFDLPKENSYVGYGCEPRKEKHHSGCGCS